MGAKYMCAKWWLQRKALFLTIKERITAWRFLLKGPSLIEDAYKKVLLPFSKKKKDTHRQFLTGKWIPFPH